MGKLTATSLVAIALVSIGIAAAMSTSTTEVLRDTTNDSTMRAEIAPQQSTAPDPPGTIDGATNPDQIPDHVAYSMLFRLVSNQQEGLEKQGVRAYLKQQVLNGAGGTSDGEAEVDAFLAVAEEFHRRVSVLDRQAAEIKNRTWPSPSPQTMADLTRLQALKEALNAEVVASMPHRLRAESVRNIGRFINEHLKRKVKITPGPATPPNGSDWQQHHPFNHNVSHH